MIERLRIQPLSEWKICLCLAAITLLSVSGCKDNPGTPDDNDDRIARIEINASKSELWLTDTLTVVATLFSDSGNPINGRPITWKSNAPNILSISAKGLVEAHSPGEAIITVQAEGISTSKIFQIYTYELIYEVAVNQQPTLYSLSLDQLSTPKQLNGLMPFAYEPSASPDGAIVAYVSIDKNLNSEIYLYDTDTQTSKRLTDNPNIDDMVAWSPDGTKIAYRSNTEGRTEDIALYNFSDQTRTNLTRDPPGIAIEDRQPSWSPDGKKIVYSSYQSGNMDLWIMNSDGSNKIQLDNHPGYDTEATWSPDGTKILFRRWSETGMSLMIYDIAAKEVEEIDLPGQQRMPAWSPDGRWIAFVSHPTLNDRPEIYIARPDGSELRLITREFSWSGGQNPTFRKMQ